jgi:uracil phosphoribosyltransferase
MINLSQFHLSEMAHCYGPNIHILDEPLAWTMLARACSSEVVMPETIRLVRSLYEAMARQVISAEFPRAEFRIRTRMADATPRAVVHTDSISRTTPVVTVGIARAGTVPSQVVFELLHDAIEPSLIRQDHLFMSRETNEQGEVTGVAWHEAKIGKEAAGRIILFPDPMGATGISMSNAIAHYKTKLDGPPAKCIAMHLIITPEYLRRMTAEHPDVSVYAWRLDRGLSSPDVLESPLGSMWNAERGLNEHQYIIPGAGGVGEILNNAWI